MSAKGGTPHAGTEASSGHHRAPRADLQPVESGAVRRPDQPGRVLLVDDETKTLSISKEILEHAGYVVYTAITGELALQSLDQNPCDAVVTDVRMPGLSGIQLLERIRQGHADLPVLIVTGHATLETAAKAVEHGAFEYLFKPIDFDMLKAALQRAIDRYHLVKDNRRLVRELRRANRKMAVLNRVLEAKVSERTRSLVLERDLLDGVFSTIPSALCVLDEAQEPTRANQAWRDLGRLGPAALEALGGAIERVVAGEQVLRGRELRLNAPSDGQPRVLRCWVLLLAGARSLLVIEDVSGERRLEEELIQAEKLASLGTLAGGIVHDLANPLTAVLGTAELLEATGPPDIQESISAIVAAADYMRQMCKGLGDFSRRARSGERALCNLNELAERAISFARFSKSFSAIEPVTELAPDLPSFLANPTEVLQVMVNLIVNGADVCPEGSQLEIRTHREDDAVQLEITDRGPGIPGHLRDQIFEPFFTTKAPGQGTGLGLYISRRVVRRIGGEIAFEAAEGGGTTFRVTFPL